MLRIRSIWGAIANPDDISIVLHIAIVGGLNKSTLYDVDLRN